MSVFAIKLLAMAAMVSDHLGWWLHHENFINESCYLLMRSFGRMSFPLFCWMLVQGWEHSKDRLKYLKRLIVFAIISQIPFVIVMTAANYGASLSGGLSFTAPGAGYIGLSILAALLWYKAVRADASALLPLIALLLGRCTLQLGELYLLRVDMNVMYTLVLSLAAIILADHFLRRDGHSQKDYMQAAALICALLVVWDSADFGLHGILLILCLWLFRDNSMQQGLMLLIWCAVYYFPGVADIGYFIGSALSLLPIRLYNGKLGKTMKTAFYLVYPLHFSMLAILSLL